jgi:hypothetical protein
MTTKPTPSEAKRFTVHLPPKALDALGKDDMIGLSGRITEVAMRYRALLDDAMPTLTQAQWCAICDVLNGTWLICEDIEGRGDPVRSVWVSVADSAEDGTGEKWNVDVPALAATLRDMPYASQAAVCEVVRRFWKHPGLNDLATVDLLRQCGARLVEDAPAGA